MKLWIYDLRTNKEFSLKQRVLTRADLDEFVACYNPRNRHERTATWSESNPQGRWRAYTERDALIPYSESQQRKITQHMQRYAPVCPACGGRS